MLRLDLDPDAVPDAALAVDVASAERASLGPNPNIDGLLAYHSSVWSYHELLEQDCLRRADALRQ